MSLNARPRNVLRAMQFRGARCVMSDGGETGFNGVGGSQVLPMLRREVIKGQRCFLGQDRHSLLIVDLVILDMLMGYLPFS